MANFEIPEQPEFNLEMRKLETSDRAHAELFNKLFLQMLMNFAALNEGKKDIVIMENDIPISERKKNTFYLNVTDKQTIGGSDTIRVSPTMGVKIL